MSRKRRRVKKSELDITLLTCGLVEQPVFKDCLEAIVRESEGIDCSVYVYMNGVLKEDRSWVEDAVHEYPDVKLKYSSERLGFPAGANRTIKQGTSPMVLFITDDIILHPNAIKELMERMKADPSIGLCGMKLIFPEDSEDKGRPAGRVQHIGHGIDIRGHVTHPLMGWKPDNEKCNRSREVISVTGGVFMVRRDVFIKAGGFFEGYGLGYFEDVDLNLEIRRLGYKIWIETAAVGTHYTNMSMMKSEVRPNMKSNEMIFVSRKGGDLVNDNWTFWAWGALFVIDYISRVLFYST
jgi:GT2 family glycosyltransferase